VSIIDSTIYALRCVFAAAPWKPTVEMRDEQWNVGQHPLDAQAQIDAYNARQILGPYQLPPLPPETLERFNRAYQARSPYADHNIERLNREIEALRDENEMLADQAARFAAEARKARAELAAVRATLQSWHRKRVTRTMQAEIRKLTERLGVISPSSS
jgi:hypothetical protein